MQIYGMFSAYDNSRRAANYAQNSAASAAKQAQYNSEYDAEVLRNQAEQERLNRVAVASEEERQVRHRRARTEAMYAKSGVLLEGTPEYMLGEEARGDIMGIDQRNLESMQKQRLLLNKAQNTLIEGDWTSDSIISQGAAQAWTYKQNGRAALISGIGGMIGTAGSAAGSMSAPAAPGGGAGTADYGSRTAPTNAAGPSSTNYNWSPSTTTSGGYSF